jgi:hypothetical protein
VRFDHLHISWKAAQHVWDGHGLETLDVREAFEDAGRRKAIYRGPNSKDGGRTYIARGRTQAGKPLWIMVKYRGLGMVSLITAREDR